MCRAVEHLAGQYRPRTENVVVLGIGGSALGAIALQKALRHPLWNLWPREKRRGPRLFVMDNIDPEYFTGMLDVVRTELSRTVFNVITKSGETAETAAQFLIVRNLLNKALGRERAQRQLIVTTDTQSGSMRKIVDREGYASLPVPDGVGGRFSVLSAVGLFPAAMCGIDTRALLRGAADMDQRLQTIRLARNPAALFAAVNYAYYQRGRVMSVMMPYANALTGLADWFRQLWAESLGKAFDAAGKRRLRIGPTPVTALGSTDQHSQVQLYREGPHDKLITFLQVSRFRKETVIPRSSEPSSAYLGGITLGRLLNVEKQATELALLASRRPSLTINFPRLDAYHVGQFIYMLECATTVAGLLFGINPYDQPGVELGKRLTYQLLGKPGFERLGGSSTCPDHPRRR
jgi:glucose-6-phosphate isomerase